MNYIIIASLLLINAAHAEDCLDRADDRYAHEYYSNRRDANAERRRHSNDECNELFEMRQRLHQLEDEIDSERREIRRLKSERGEK
jgi:hypothetical protein